MWQVTDLKMNSVKLDKRPWTIFQEFDPEKRKVICKSLRFVAHSHGAHLQVGNMIYCPTDSGPFSCKPLKGAL